MSRKRIKKQIQSNLVDILIPNYRRFDMLKKCLDSIPGAMGTVSYRVLIWDNASPPDERKEFFSNYKPEFEMKVYESSSNLGYPGAVNALARRSHAPLLFILTNDVELDANSGDAMVRELDDLQIGVVGMKLLFPSGTPHGPAGKIQHVGLGMNIRAEVFHLFITWSPDNPKVQSVREVFAVTGAAFMTRRNIWNRIGGFNLDYGLGTYEDVEYCMQVSKLGYNIIVSQKATGYHWVNATASAYNMQFPLNENRQLFMSRFGKELSWNEYKYW